MDEKCNVTSDKLHPVRIYQPKNISSNIKYTDMIWNQSLN